MHSDVFLPKSPDSTPAGAQPASQGASAGYAGPAAGRQSLPADTSLAAVDARIARMQKLRWQATQALRAWAMALPGAIPAGAQYLCVQPEYLRTLFSLEGSNESLDTLIAMLLRVGKQVELQVH